MTKSLVTASLSCLCCLRQELSEGRWKKSPGSGPGLHIFNDLQLTSWGLKSLCGLRFGPKSVSVRCDSLYLHTLFANLAVLGLTQQPGDVPVLVPKTTHFENPMFRYLRWGQCHQSISTPTTLDLSLFHTCSYPSKSRSRHLLTRRHPHSASKASETARNDAGTKRGVQHFKLQHERAAPAAGYQHSLEKDGCRIPKANN